MINKTISHYKIIEEIGRGGMGVVYKAEDTKLQRTVALKFLPPDLTRNPEANERFMNEARAASAFDHPNICTIYDIKESDDGSLYIVMPCYEGESLKEKIARAPLPVDEATDIAVQVARGLAKAHKKGIIHRDIKSANIIITNDGIAKILDFGVAKLAGQQITKTGSTIGTVAYMSPEQAPDNVPHFLLDTGDFIYYIGCVIICGQNFSPELIGGIQAKIDTHPGLSRRKLSQQICEWLDWRNPRGDLKQMSCRVALLRLHEQGHIQLPPLCGTTGPPPKSNSKAGWESFEEPSALIGSLAELGRVELIAIKSSNRTLSRRWNQLMDQYHYLGSGPLCGAQLRYLIHSEHHGYLGGFAFSSGAWRLAARDKWIGWSDRTRAENLDKVVCNSRFLIVPQVKVAGLASHVLSLSAKRLGADWLQRYGVEPALLETFVERDRFKGTCYRAANWQHIGETKGRGRQDHGRTNHVAIKDIYIYPLHRDARKILCNGQPEPVHQPQDPIDWAEAEFATVDLGDARRHKRLLTIARDFFAQPRANIPQACQSRAKTKAVYRFFEDKNNTMDKILAPHYETTLSRAQQEKVVLVAQDTTTLNYSTHPATQDLGLIGSKQDGPIGLIVHDTMAFNLEGTPLGLLDVQCWARDPADFGKKHLRAQLAIEQKESNKWLKSFQATAEAQKRCPDTTFVNMGDREADIYELFHLALSDPEGPRLLVRSEYNRLLADGQGHLWDHVASQELGGIQTVHVPRKGNRCARDARLEVRFAQVTLKPPQNKKHLDELNIWAVFAEEVDAPDGVTPLKWMLLTTCPVHSFENAVEKLDWYCGRWGIEVYHRTLKSGCKIEQRQLGSADRIEACLAIDMVIAWRIYHLTKLGRETPDVPCTVFFEECEWKALVAYKTQNPIPPDNPPSLREMTRMVASLGGFLGRKGDGEPGTQTLWLGLQRLEDITEMWRITISARAPHLVKSPVSSNPGYG